jgi:hypothetical protein
MSFLRFGKTDMLKIGGTHQRELLAFLHLSTNSAAAYATIVWCIGEK